MQKIKFILINILLLMISACSGSNDPEDDVWVVGTSADNPPYEYIKEGEVVGFDIDLINEIAKKMDKSIEIKNMEFNGLIAALGTKNIDAVVAGLSITEERSKVVDFTDSYKSTNITVLTRKDDFIKNIKDLKGKKIGSQLGTLWAVAAYEIASKEEAKTMNLSNNLMLIEELKNGRIDAVILEEFQAIEFTAKHNKLAHFKVESHDSDLAIALPKNSKHTDQVNKVLKELKENGFIKVLKEKWGVN